MAPKPSRRRSMSSSRTKRSKSISKSMDMPSLDYKKVRKVMKKHNTKKMDNETMHKIAKELDFELPDMKHERFLRGKMLASVRTWDKE